MKKIVILVLAFVINVSAHLELVLQDNNNIIFNSSMRGQAMSVSLSSYGKLNSSFFVESEIYSPLRNRHQFIHDETKIKIIPELKQQLVKFNDFDGQQYWFTVKSPVKLRDGKKQVNFVGLRIIQKGQNVIVHDYLLPTFTQPCSFLPLGSFYKCGNTIISYRHIFGHYKEISMFAISGENSWQNPEGKWSWSWNRKDENNVDIGRFRTKEMDKIVIVLKNGIKCQIKQGIQPADNRALQKSGYLTIQQVLTHSTPLPAFEQPLEL